ncbi:MAG: thiopeptide-type bacteriocin biosynthesis protein [Allomuricauda sp.]
MNKNIQRNFVLGDSWLYYKIYTGPNTSDNILTEIIKPVSEHLVAKNIIDKWFFIRYADPRHHLRVRFHYAKPENIALIINRLYPYFNDFVKQDLIWKIQVDTYQRELERYGANTMELSEALFYQDSLLVVNFLNMIEGDEGEELRWLFALRVMDAQLNSFTFGDNEKLVLLNMLKTNFGNEFGMSRPLKKQLDDKFRKSRKKIEFFMAFSTSDDSDYQPLIETINMWRDGTKGVITQILMLNREGRLQVDFMDLISSYLHMFMNRLFKSKNRLHELVCYDFLYRYYKSQVARKKYQTKEKTTLNR